MLTITYSEFQLRHGRYTTLPYAVERVTISYLALPPQIDLYLPAGVTLAQHAAIEQALVLDVWRDPDVRLYQVEGVPGAMIGATWQHLRHGDSEEAT